MAQGVETFGAHSETYYKVTGNVVKSLNTGHGCVYGTKSVSSGSHEWIIEYKNTVSRCCGAIGITSHSDQLTKWGTDTASTVCLYHAGPKTSQSRINLTGSNKNTTVDTKLQTGDTIRIALNYDEKTVIFYDKNDAEIFSVKELPIGQNIAYRVFVDGDNTNDQYMILKSAGGLFTGLMEISLKDISADLEVINKALQKANEKIKTLSMEQLAQIKQETSGFLTECKEFEQNFENTKNAIQSLENDIDKEMNPNTNNYKEWTADHICRYVLSLEKQRFAKYIDPLKAALEKQQIAGADLPEIEANDLYTMGIDNFKDRKSLAKYFKNLDSTEGDVATENH